MGPGHDLQTVFSKSLFTHTTLHILQFGQDVQREAVSLASGPVPSVHEVSKSQDQTQDLLHCLSVL